MKEEKFDKIMQYLEKLDKRISMIEENLPKHKAVLDKSNNSISQEREESFREFFIKYNPQKETDKTLVIIYFLELRRKMEHITTKEITLGFKEVREMLPKNISDKMQMLHKRGFIAPKDGMGRLKSWTITRSGLEHLEKLKDGKKEN